MEVDTRLKSGPPISDHWVVGAEEWHEHEGRFCNSAMHIRFGDPTSLGFLSYSSLIHQTVIANAKFPAPDILQLQRPETSCSNALQLSLTLLVCFEGRPAVKGRTLPCTSLQLRFPQFLAPGGHPLEERSSPC